MASIAKPNPYKWLCTQAKEHGHHIELATNRSNSKLSELRIVDGAEVIARTGLRNRKPEDPSVIRELTQQLKRRAAEQ